MENTLHVGCADESKPPSQPRPYILHPIDRIDRMIGFVWVLRDGFELAGRDYSEHLARYMILCDTIVEEIEIALKQLQR